MNFFKNVKGVIDDELIRSNFYKLLWDYFYIYEWNSAFQINFEHLIKYILENPSNYSTSISHVIHYFNTNYIYLLY